MFSARLPITALIILLVHVYCVALPLKNEITGRFYNYPSNSYASTCTISCMQQVINGNYDMTIIGNCVREKCFDFPSVTLTPSPSPTSPPMCSLNAEGKYSSCDGETDFERLCNAVLETRCVSGTVRDTAVCNAACQDVCPREVDSDRAVDCLDVCDEKTAEVKESEKCEEISSDSYVLCQSVIWTKGAKQKCNEILQASCLT